MSKGYLLGIGILIFFSAFSLVTFKSSLTPYVSFAEAKSLQSSMQISGMLVAGSMVQREQGKQIAFLLCDDNGEQLTVVYHGARPGGFEQASSIVAIGKYRNQQFNAERLLVKCPSKYQQSQGGDSNL